MRCPHCGNDFWVTPEYPLPRRLFIIDGKCEMEPAKYTNDPAEYIMAIHAYEVQQRLAFEATDT